MRRTNRFCENDEECQYASSHSMKTIPISDRGRHHVSVQHYKWPEKDAAVTSTDTIAIVTSTGLGCLNPKAWGCAWATSASETSGISSWRLKREGFSVGDVCPKRRTNNGYEISS